MILFQLFGEDKKIQFFYTEKKWFHLRRKMGNFGGNKIQLIEKPSIFVEKCNFFAIKSWESVNEYLKSCENYGWLSNSKP